MRWIALVLGILAITGCSDLAYGIRREARKIVQSFRDAPKDRSSSSYADQSDESKARHERTVVNTLNGWIGNRPYE